MRAHGMFGQPLLRNCDELLSPLSARRSDAGALAPLHAVVFRTHGKTKLLLAIDSGDHVKHAFRFFLHIPFQSSLRSLL